MPIAHRIIPTLSEKDLARFWGKVEVRGESECWPWKGHCKGGYGQFGIGGKDKSRNHMFFATRVAYAISKYDPPSGELVCHTCDNPVCVNPSHLFLGDQSKNMRDMISKGRDRKARGENNANSKLTKESVIEIRRRYRRGKGSGDSAEQLGPEFGVSATQIRLIVAGKFWKHVF